MLESPHLISISQIPVSTSRQQGNLLWEVAADGSGLRAEVDSFQPPGDALINIGRAAQFLSQPFLVGDRVEVATGNGARVLTGVIERIDPMRTIVRSDAEVPITIPNKARFTSGCPCSACHCIRCSQAVDCASRTTALAANGVPKLSK